MLGFVFTTLRSPRASAVRLVLLEPLEELEPSEEPSPTYRGELKRVCPPLEPLEKLEGLEGLARLDQRKKRVRSRSLLLSWAVALEARCVILRI